MPKRVHRQYFHFPGNMRPAAVASPDGCTWNKKVTAAAGSPTVLANAGTLELAFDNTNEVQNLCLYFGDVLTYDIDDLIAMEFLARVTASLDSTITAVMGLASARHDTPDSVAANAWFRLQGSNTLLCESDDGTTDLDDKATGLTLSTTFRRFRIDFAEGLVTKGPPSTSVGGKGSVVFSAEDSNGCLRRVAQNTQFDMSAYSSGLQPLFQIQKTAGTVTGTLGIREVMIEHRIAG